MKKSPYTLKEIEINAWQRYLQSYEELKYFGRKPSNVIPLEIEFRITKRCNLNCRMCHVDKINKKDELSLEQVKKIIQNLRLSGTVDNDLTKNIKEKEIKAKVKRDEAKIHLVITGGEPFLYPHLKEVIKFASSEQGGGLKGTIITNATVLDKRVIDTIIQNGWDIMVSLDGSKAEIHDKIRGKAGTFAKAMQFIGYFNQRRKGGGKEEGEKEREGSRYSEDEIKSKLKLSFIIQNENAGDIVDFCRLADTLGADDVHSEFISFFASNFGEKSIQLLKDEFEKYLGGEYQLKGADIFKEYFKVFKAIKKGHIKTSDISQGVYMKNLFRIHPPMCLCCLDMGFIESDGRLFPCIHYANKDRNCIGSIRDDSLANIYNSDGMNHFLKRNLKIDINSPEFLPCWGCFEFFKHMEVERVINNKKNKAKENGIKRADIGEK